MKCDWCDAEAAVELRVKLDAPHDYWFSWDAYCLECAERYVTHWRSNDLEWQRRAVEARP